MSVRLAQLRTKMAAAECECLLITDEINVRYLTGFTGDSSYLLVTSSEAIILSDRRYETQLANECPDFSTAIRPPSKSMPSLVAEVLENLRAKQIFFESHHVSVAMLGTLTSLVDDKELRTSFKPVSGWVESLRMIKDAEEVKTLRRAIDIAERAFRSVTCRLTPEMTERQVAHQLEEVMRNLGADGVSFEPIVGAQPRGALPHYRPGHSALASTPTLLIDWGASYQGYASDLTRTLHQPTASDHFRRAYEVVLEAQLAAIEAISDGTKASDVDQVARDAIAKAGLGDAFKHGLGHGIGLQIHESPRMASISDEILKSGMVITVEPGVYFEGEFGIRIEDDILVTDTGCEVLSTLGKGLDDCRLIL